MILTLNIQFSRSGTVWRWSRCRAGQGWKTSHWLHGSSWLEHSHSRGLDKGNGVPYLRAELSRLTYQLAIWLPLTQKTQLASTLELHSMATSPNWGDSLTSDDHFLAGSPRWLFDEGLFFITNRDPSKSKQFFITLEHSWTLFQKEGYARTPLVTGSLLELLVAAKNNWEIFQSIWPWDIWI